MAVIPTFQSGCHETTGLCTALNVTVEEQYGVTDYQRYFHQCDGEGGAFDYGGFHNDFNKRGQDLVH